MHMKNHLVIFLRKGEGKIVGQSKGPHFQQNSFLCNYIISALGSYFIKCPQCHVPEKEDCLKLALLAFCSLSLSQDMTQGPFPSQQYLFSRSHQEIQASWGFQVPLSAAIMSIPACHAAPLCQLPGCHTKWNNKQLPCGAVTTPSKRKGKHNGSPKILTCLNLRFLIPRPAYQIHTIPSPFEEGDVR